MELNLNRYDKTGGRGGLEREMTWTMAQGRNENCLVGYHTLNAILKGGVNRVLGIVYTLYPIIPVL